MKRLRTYFIGDYLAAEPDILKQASITLIYNILLLCEISLVIISVSHVINNNTIQVVKGLLIFSLFCGCLFYMKAFKRIDIIGHLMILISGANIQVDVFVLFHDINMFPALIAILNVIFAFHILGSRAGFFYAFLHF